jgi:hypothetical protein
MKLDAQADKTKERMACKKEHRSYVGKEGITKRKCTIPEREPLKKRVKITRDEWVYGPNADLLLEKWESELATVTRCVWKCV